VRHQPPNNGISKCMYGRRLIPIRYFKLCPFTGSRGVTSVPLSVWWYTGALGVRSGCPFVVPYWSQYWELCCKYPLSFRNHAPSSLSPCTSSSCFSSGTNKQTYKLLVSFLLHIFSLHLLFTLFSLFSHSNIQPRCFMGHHFPLDSSQPRFLSSFPYICSLVFQCGLLCYSEDVDIRFLRNNITCPCDYKESNLRR
jgi:hypothetical protein